MSGFANIEGHGVRGTVAGHDVDVGRPALPQKAVIVIPAEITRAVAGAQIAGQTVVVASGAAAPGVSSRLPTR